MKSGNYEELKDKFYAGLASKEEILLLKSKGLIDESDELYKATIKAEKTQTMDWDFEDFMKEVPKAKVVALPAKQKWFTAAMSAAAVVLLVLAVYVLLPQKNQQPSTELAIVPAIKETFDTNSKSIAKTIVPEDEIKKDIPLPKKENLNTTKNSGYAVKIKNKIGMKKSSSAIKKESIETNANLDDYLVMVNGKPIYNEEDAVAITRQSLGLVSRNLTTTMDELKPIGHIKIKF